MKRHPSFNVFSCNAPASGSGALCVWRPGDMRRLLALAMLGLSLGLAGAQPVNDHFANAIVISGVSGAVTGNNVLASKQPGEPNHAGNTGGRSVWWQWTAPGNGPAAFDTFGSDFDTLLAVYTGGSVGSLTLVVSNDDSGDLQSRVVFAAVAGATYRIAVDGYGGDQGNIALNWGTAMSPDNDDFVNAAVIAGASGVAGGSNLDAGKEAGEPNHAGNSGGASVWWSWTAPENGVVTFDTLGSDFDTLLAVYRGGDVAGLRAVAANDDAGGTFQSRVKFMAGAGMTFWIAVDGYEGDSGNIFLNWSSGPAPRPPANDAFAAAKVIMGEDGSVVAQTILAGKESGEANHAGNSGGRSLWYAWTASQSGLVTFETVHSNFDTLLAVYTGIAFGALEQVAANDRIEGAPQSRVSFEAAAGVAYRIAVDGHNDGLGADGGTLVLDWHYGGTPPVRDLLPDLFVWADIDEEFLHGWYLDTEEIPGRTLLRVTTATPNVGRGPLELRSSRDDAEVYQRIYRTDGSFHDRLAGTFTFHPEHGHLHFDDFVQFHLRSTEGGIGPVIVSGAKISFAVMDLDAYDLMLAGAPAEDRYSGGLIQGISVGWVDIYDASLTDQWIDITGVPDGTYWLEAVVDPENRILESDEENNATRILITLPPSSPGAPDNDHFANARIIEGPAGMEVGNNINADTESGEPLHAGNPGGRSVWHRWTAPGSGPATFDTRGSSFSTVLGIYTGETLWDLAVVAENEDFDPPGRVFSEASFAAVAGQEYWIAVDGYLGQRGDVVLNWSMIPPAELRIAGWFRLPDGRLVLECAGEPGIDYALDGTVDLSQWSERGVAGNTTGVFSFTNEVSNAAEFFRVRRSGPARFE